ncbi:hypothetical protein ABZZ74_50055 [Streptomyces sp. NPDC006476]|uniref:hypothetical protein n=1 Tax=Streptomyces sp. NPDC006476 TaxID=3157175 RepID=UPI0033A407B8
MEHRLGDLYPRPEFSASTIDGFQGAMRWVTPQHTAVNELWGSSPLTVSEAAARWHFTDSSLYPRIQEAPAQFARRPT